MAEDQDRRRRAIADLIRSSTLASQDELAQRLTALGYGVTQATISRDLEHIGALKVRRNGHLIYALPEQVRESANPQLAAVFRDWVRSVDPAATMVVLKTPPGSAHLVGVTLDGSDIQEIAGTICGDDTIFVACRSQADAEMLVSRFRELIS